MFHYVVIVTVIERVDWRWPTRLLLSLGLTVAAAALSYAVLEQPFLRLKARFTYVRSAPV